jgi:16S rRNA (guanine966-N2)-methyltransferase
VSQRASANEVRLIGGQWKRSKLQVLDKPGLRPTPNRVRETLFNWLGQDMSGWRCVDVFAGSGALGFEAASRGASHVVLVERDAALVRCLRDSQSRLKANSVQVEAGDGLAYLQNCAKGSVDLVFLDPPFEANLFDAALTAAAPVLTDIGWAYLEADRVFTEVTLRGAGWSLHRSGRAGAVFFHLLQRSSAAGGHIKSAGAQEP